MRNRSVCLCLLFFLLIGLLLPASNSAAVHSSTLTEKRYRKAATFYNNLIFNKGERERMRWLDGVKMFQKAYHQDPGHDKAPFCLYMLGKIYNEMYDRFHDSHDLTEAAGYYEDLTMIFPGHSLADDALFHLAVISIDKKENGKKAEMLLARLITVYPQGDMAAAAADKLREIKTFPKNGAAQSSPRQQSAPAHLSQPIKFWSTKDYTRIVIETSEPIQFKEAFLPAEKGLPKRLYIDLFNCRIAPTFQNPIPISDGLLKRVRGAQFNQDTVRVVLDTESVGSHKVFALDDPFRVVIDVTGTRQQAKKPPQIRPKTTPAKVKTRTADRLPTLAEQFGLGVKNIVIDPGHGGKDPGALGNNGLKEKDIVLKVAKKVADILRKETAFNVILTRDRDVFLPLEERTAIANTRDADLFLSIHANSAENRSASGVETYYLSLATSREEMQAAALENAASASRLSDLQNILQDLMQNSKIEESVRFAGSVQNTLITGLNRQYRVNNLGVKKAPFIVLIGAQMPAVLTEIAFLSNSEDEKRLRDDRYLEAVARHIADGVRHYAANLNGL